ARGALVRNRLREEVNAAVTIQACWRRFVEERKYRQIRNTVLAIQAACRGRDYRNHFAERKQSGASNRCPTLGIAKVIHKHELASFDLNDPESLAPFAFSDEEESSSTTDLLDEEEEEDSVVGVFSGNKEDRSDIDLDATFILEDKKLKLIGEKKENDPRRRQSLATTCSTTKVCGLSSFSSIHLEIAVVFTARGCGRKILKLPCFFRLMRRQFKTRTFRECMREALSGMLFVVGCVLGNEYMAAMLQDCCPVIICSSFHLYQEK
uniref:Myosin motor domain-containing protein n=1 Tax=Parascaris univalens TaxID=6257 RepID=A0A915BDA5_PARUN